MSDFGIQFLESLLVEFFGGCLVETTCKKKDHHHHKNERKNDESNCDRKRNESGFIRVKMTIFLRNDDDDFGNQRERRRSAT